MPDDKDYEDLGRLLAHPELWTEDDVAKARMLRKQ
jgi:hypothetical protein